MGHNQGQREGLGRLHDGNSSLQYLELIVLSFLTNKNRSKTSLKREKRSRVKLFEVEKNNIFVISILYYAHLKCIHLLLTDGA